MKSTYRELVRQGFGFTNLNYTAVFSYDAAGRLVREGDKTYRYGYLDKVLSVTDGKRSYRYAYHVDGQLARADYGEGDGGRAGVGEDGRAGSPLPAGSEDFLWDGLALVRRGDESFVNEPHAGDAPKKLRFGGKPRAKRSARRARKGPRGNPVVSSKGAAYFNDVLGTTVGVREGRGASRKGAKRRYTAAALTAFGEPVPVAATSHNSNIRQFDHSIISSPFFTGKPQVEGLGRVFLYRNYRADLAKWQTDDPLGYPDGWNPLAYCENKVTCSVDLFGAHTITNEELGYASSLGLGCWYILVAECTGNYENLNITYSITMRNGSLTSFNAPYSHYDEKYGRIYDPTATISGFSSATENLQRISSKRSEINELRIEFDWIVSYTVNMAYQYEAEDPVTGEIKTYTGHLDLPRRVSKHVVLRCYHRKME